MRSTRLGAGTAACGLLWAGLALQAPPATAAGPLAPPVPFVQCLANEPGSHLAQTDTSACSVGGGALGASGGVSLAPFVLLWGQANAYGFPANAVGATVTARLDFEFQVTGGQPGDMVPILIETHMQTVGRDSSKAWALTTLNAGNGLGQGVGAAACSPDLNCDGGAGGGASFNGVLALHMKSGGPNGSVFLSLTVAAGSSFVDEFASAWIDPYFFVDPSFANAGLYTVTLSPGVANAPVPEPASAMLLLGGLAAVLGLVRRRN